MGNDVGRLGVPGDRHGLPVEGCRDLCVVDGLGGRVTVEIKPKPRIGAKHANDVEDVRMRNAARRRICRRRRGSLLARRRRLLYLRGRLVPLPSLLSALLARRVLGTRPAIAFSALGLRLVAGRCAARGAIVAAVALSALALVIAFKGLAYAISLGSFRGGPVFPALFLGAAAGLMAAHLPGFEATPAVAVGMGAAVVAVLRLPLSAVVLALLLASKGGLATSPLIIVGVVVAYLTTMAATRGEEPTQAADAHG